MNRTLFFLLMIALCVCMGCDGKQQLGGKVTFSDDGSPVTMGAVFFTTPTFVAQGDIKSDGTYVVSSTGMNDGIPPGKYQVYIGGVETVETKEMGGRTITNRTSLINTKYQSPSTSGLEFTVDGSTRKFDIQVDRAK